MYIYIYDKPQTQTRCDNRVALTFEVRANTPRMRLRPAKWRLEIISILACFEPKGPEGTSTRPGQGNHGYMEIELRALLRNELPGTLVSFDDKLLATVRSPAHYSSRW